MSTFVIVTSVFDEGGQYDIYKKILPVIAVALVLIDINMTVSASAGPEIVQVDIVTIDEPNIVPFGTPSPVQILQK